MAKVAVVLDGGGNLTLTFQHQFAVVLHLQQYEHLLQQYDVQVDLLLGARTQAPGERALVHQVVIHQVQVLTMSELMCQSMVWGGGTMIGWQFYLVVFNQRVRRSLYRPRVQPVL